MIENEVSDGTLDPVVLRVYGTVEHVLKTVMEKRISILNERFPRDTPDTNAPDVEETILHILHELRQGIYVLIRRGHVRLMAIIANAEYRDRVVASNLTFYAPEQVDMFAYKSRKEAMRRDVRKETWVDSDRWWASSGILCQVNRAFGWGTGMVADLLRDLRIMCSKQCIADHEFILNRRDIPMVRMDGLHPYQFAGAQFLTNFRMRLPVYSLYTGDAFLDKPWLTPTTSFNISEPTPWKDKTEVALFRGSLTGSGTFAYNNTRLAVSLLDHPLVDAKIVRLSLRDKVRNCEVRFDAPECVDTLVDPIPIQDWESYKYLIYCHGHSAALRLYPMLAMNSVIIYVEPSDPNYMCEANKLWFHDMVEFFRLGPGDPAGAHAVYVDRIDDIPNAVKFLKDNDQVAHQIAENARKLYEKLDADRHNLFAQTLPADTSAS